jgi:hypothetical protein
VDYDSANASALKRSILFRLDSFGVPTKVADPALSWQVNRTTSSILFHNINNTNMNSTLRLPGLQDLYGNSLTSN